MLTRNKILAGGGGLLGSALLAVTLTSPSTLATWSNNLNLDNATITSGNLEATPLGSMAWSDSSDPANPVNIDLNTYKIVPGDTLTSTQDIDMALEGDNILASFDLDFALASSGDLLAGLTITYDVVDENGVEVVPETAYDTAATQFIVGENDVTPDLDSTKDYTVRIKVVFPDTTINRDYTEVNAILNSAQVHVKQVRSGVSSAGGSTGGGVTTPVVTMGYKLAMGYYHTLAVQSDGTVKAAGRNNYGQLGLGNMTDTAVPTVIPGLSNVKNVYTGIYHSFALLNDGSVYGWGSNVSGELGLGDATNRLSPTLTTLSNVKRIAGGRSHSVVLTNDGTVLSSGGNNYGQVGVGNTTNQMSFSSISGLSNITEINVSAYSSFAVDNNGNVKAWGYNVYNLLADGTVTNRTSPVLSTINNVKEIKCGLFHCFAVKNNNDVYGWGYNLYGQTGISGTNSISTPTHLNSLGAIEIIIPFTHSTYLKTVSGDHYLWGYNSNGQLGNGTTNNVTTPTLTNNIQNGDILYATNMARHVFNHKVDGSWQSWGGNTYGQLFLGNNLSVTTPQTLPVNAF